MSKNTYLKEIGIDIWIERNPKTEHPDNNILEASNIGSPIPITTEAKIETKEEVKPATSVIETVDIQSLDWQALQKQVSSCHLCELSQSRTQINFGLGNQTASLLIIADDTNTESSKLLTSMLKAMGYQRRDVYITDVLKCGMAENIDATESQAESCEPYFFRQVSLVQPKLIIALGNAAAQYLLKSKSTMNRLRGQLHYVDGIAAPILVSYHPTYLLASPNEKRKSWEDLQLAMKELVE